MLMIFVGFFFPFTVTLLLYATMFLLLRINRTEIELNFNASICSKSSNKSSVINIKSNRKIKRFTKELFLMRNSILAVSLFALTWLPYVVMALLAQYSENKFNYVTPKTTALPIFVAKSSAILVPILYVFTHKDFKTYLFTVKSKMCRLDRCSCFQSD
jgi:hypothetical protein